MQPYDDSHFTDWNDDSRLPDVDAMLGKTATAVTLGPADDYGVLEVVFEFDDGTRYRLWHDQDCCETVRLDDVCGDLEDLVGSPLLMAERASSPEDLGAKRHRNRWYDAEFDDPSREFDTDDSYTWTFYKFATMKGCVTLRWYGGSNGYYSERVNFEPLGAS